MVTTMTDERKRRSRWAVLAGTARAVGRAGAARGQATTAPTTVLRRTAYGLATLALAAGSTTALATSANALDAGARPTLKTVRSLPFTGHGDEDGNGDGGRGTVRANAAVSAACNGGNPISAPQWYSVGKKVTGSLRVVVDGVWYPRGIDQFPTGSAVVDHWSGEVLACTGQTLPRASRPVDVVGFTTVPYGYSPYSPFDLVTSIVPAASAPPANDEVIDAQPVPALPFTSRVDTSLADADGPDLIDYEHCLLSAINPVKAGTVWYRYRPTKTGPAPVVSVSPSTNWTAGNTDGGVGLRSGILELRPDGSTRLVTNDDPWDCDTPVRLTKGKTYLIGVAYTWDEYSDSIPLTGGPIDVSVTAR